MYLYAVRVLAARPTLLLYRVICDTKNGSRQFHIRPYQAQLEEVAINKNTIIHLPTGSGKTFIAIRLITRFREALQKPWGAGGKRTFFLVNTIPLVNQQKKVIENICPVNGVGAYSGEDRVDYWNKDKWDEELSKNQVIVMTCQILSDMLTHQYIQIEDINLLIFDECHHAVDDHPMRLVMKHFEHCPTHKHPRVLGLTATLLNSNVAISSIQQSLKDLETTFHATIATVNELGEVLNYSTNPNEFVEFYQTPQVTPSAAKALDILRVLIDYILSVQLPQTNLSQEIKLKKYQQDITTDPKKIVKAVKNMISSVMMFIKDLGVYGGSLSITSYIILLERLKRKSLSKEQELLYEFVITHLTKARMILLLSMSKEEGYERIIKHSSDQIIQLLNVLKEFNPDLYNKPGVIRRKNKSNEPLSGIIFTQQRFTAKILYNLLKDVKQANPEEFSFLKHDFLVGFNIDPYKSTREQAYVKKASHKALLKFRNKELNCLIATSVIEEGVDIPQCLLVLRFDAPLEYRSYIQSKGRARSADSSFVLLVNSSDRDKFMSKYHSFMQTEKYIQKLLVGSSDTREAPSESSIQTMYDEDDIPPYNNPYGSCLHAVGAISLLNRYCSCLPHDQFTTITPMWIKESVDDHRGHYAGIVVTIIMPIACPVKEPIKGKPYLNLKIAKRSAALNACIRLHQEGELDRVTMLPRNYGNVDFEVPDIRSCFLNWPWDQEDEDDEGASHKAGTKKRMRKHDKVFPLYLSGSMSHSQQYYLHIIKLKIGFERPQETRERALYDLLLRDEGYGFITPEAVPKICQFPMFLAVGDVMIEVHMNYAVIPLNSDMVDLIKRFHFFVFDQVLEIAKKFLIYDGTVNNLFVVPVKGSAGGYDIDWQVMQKYKEIPPVPPSGPPYEERKALEVTQEDYQYSVVTPWYRGAILPSRYIVSNVIEYMTPKSAFDDSSYDTYEQYYSAKYHLEIIGRKDQPLLEVRNITTRMNCLLPRAATINAFTDKQKKLISVSQGDDKPKSFTEIFIPEFCVKYDYPGVLWYKATMLPSIIHRVHMLLIAYDLRAEITKYTQYGLMHLPKGTEIFFRINNPIDPENAPRRPIVSMKESLYQLQQKKINKEYPWDAKMEPIDIERNISSVTLMDIECYDEFVSAPLYAREEMSQLSVMRSPPRVPNATAAAAAILPPPLKYNDKIKLLSLKPTGRGPELRDILFALTTINSHDTANLERAETLGDSFLKFAASLYLYHKFPKLNEGQLTNIKGRLIGNRNLYYAGARVKLGGRMKVEQFSPRKDFLVPGFLAPRQVQQFMEGHCLRPTFLIGIQFPLHEALSGNLSDESYEQVTQRYSENGVVEREPPGGAQNVMQCYVRSQVVSDKSVADCVEAIIGTYLLHGGVLGAVKVLEWLRVLPAQDNFASYLGKKVPTVITDGKSTLAEMDFLLNSCQKDIEQIINYKFNDPSFLLEALSHPSYIRNRLTRSYERLEFLGDAILDFLITSHIFENCDQLKPGELTDLRSALVNNVTFASYVVKLGLHKFLCSQLNPTLDKAIMMFVEHQEQRDHEIIEDVLYLIDEEDCHIAEYVEVPKVLSDIFESLMGAIYLDSGGNLSAVWAVVYRIMHREIEAFSTRIPQQPVRVLYERIHACTSFGTAKVVECSTPRVMVPVTFTKNGRPHTAHGFGGNKFQAKRAAAKLALKILDS
ncbi:endoribonuclease Dicer [Leguminivora glycinivorella]|uniref:endoribonuclease Dicer n=1 Tax=Leguminivora glycinivorella TaxID=1035111 RepID=UPI00200CE13F|nr:endoribonuclease Dicer [Leguminivora glycinivorella]